MITRIALLSMCAGLAVTPAFAQQAPGPAALPSSTGAAYLIRAGRLIDPETGTATANQSIAVKDGFIVAVGAGVAAPPGAETIDLSQYSVLPGLVDAHNHLALTYKKIPENDVYYYTYIQESTALRAIQAASNGMQMLSAGFTVVRDLGNNGLYADAALRVAIEQGWLPGPTLINSGIIIGGMGGQFHPTPEMVKEHAIVYPEYLDADTPDEIIKAVRQNVLFGAKVIKICVDCQPYAYSVDDMKLFIKEAANAGGLKVAGHVQTAEGARRAIEAGIWSIEHSFALTDELQKQIAKGDLARRHGDAVYRVRRLASSVRSHCRGHEDRLRRRCQDGLLDRCGLLRPRHEPRTGGDQLPEKLEGCRHSRQRDSQDHDHQRLQGHRYL